jgi:CheY-like chemotaxis protein
LGFVADLLIDGGHFVLRASDGSAAVPQVNEYPGKIDLMLSDFQMPGMSGIELHIMGVDRAR